jgi:transposase-like protein
MARIGGPRKAYRYSVDFELKAVKFGEIRGVRVQDVADALDIQPFMLSRWRKEAREGRLKARVAVAPEARAQREVPGNLLVYAAATWLVMAHGGLWRPAPSHQAEAA